MRPQVFTDIIENEQWRDNIRRQKVIPHRDFLKFKSLRDDLRLNLIPSAEKCLKWNTDKGDRK